MRRACKLTLKYCTDKKRKHINAFLEAYRTAVNFYINKLWTTKGRLDKETLAWLSSSHTRLSAHYKSQALKQTLEIVTGTKIVTKKRKTKSNIPVFKGSAVLDAKFIKISEDTNISFDLTLKIASLTPRKPITLVTKKTKVFNKWRDKLNAKVIQGCRLSENNLVVWIDIPVEETLKQDNVLGIDISVNKLLSTSEGKHYGREFKPIRDQITRKQRGSKSSKKALRHRDQYIIETVNQLPWQDLDVIVIEDLKNLKKDKNKKRSKSFHKAITPWTYRSVIKELYNKAQQNCVRVVAVSPQYTSQKYSSCGLVDKDNRKNEYFKCISCGYSHDANTVATINIKALFYD